MNHYPHHLGDYAKDTLGFSMLEHGAYRLLLDAYYASEHAPAADEVYAIAKATTGTDRKAVDKVLKKFQLRDGHYHHKRVEAELKAFRERSKSAAEKARKRWEKDAGSNAAASPEQMQKHQQQQSNGSASSTAGAMLASNHKPETPNHRFPGDRDITSPAETAKAAPAEPPNPEAAARIVAQCAQAGVTEPASDAIVQRWIRNGVTPTQVTRATNDAPFSKNAPKPMTSAYLDPIVERIVENDRKAKARSDASHQATQQQLAEQRARESSPMPESLRPRVRTGEGTA